MRRPFVLPGPDVGRLLLDRLVAEGVRYGRDFALVRIVVPLGTADEIAPLLAAILRDADVLVRWEADELLALLPATDRAGADRAAQRLRRRATCRSPSARRTGSATPPTTCSAAPNRGGYDRPLRARRAAWPGGPCRSPRPPSTRPRSPSGGPGGRSSATIRSVAMSLNIRSCVGLLDQRLAHRGVSRIAPRITWSRSPLRRSRSPAVFAPMPFAPGSPSEGSPRSAMKSGTCAGSIP